VHQVSGLVTRLNISTRHWHADVDEPWLDLLRPLVTRADYLAQLVRTYGFVAPFESACRYTPGLARELDFHHFSRAGLIAQDLLSLGLLPAQVASIPHCPSITMFRDIAEALGWLYVVERFTLLHDGIRRHLIKHLPDIESATTYLKMYEGHVGEHWSSFGRLLDRVGTKDERANEIVAAASAGFGCVRQWFRSFDTGARRHVG
jgi:heme oxygenase